MKQHIYSRADHTGIYAASGNGVHHNAKPLAAGREAGNHRRLQSEDRHDGRHKVQRHGCGKNRASKLTKQEDIFNGQPQNQKCIEGGKVYDISRIGKARIGGNHQKDHAAHRDIHQEQQPRRFAVALVFAGNIMGALCLAVANAQVAAQQTKAQIIDRHREEPDRAIHHAGHTAKNHVDKIDEHTAINAYTTAKSQAIDKSCTEAGRGQAANQQRIGQKIGFPFFVGRNSFGNGKTPDHKGIRRQTEYNVCRRSLRSICLKDVGRILRTFKIKKNVEVTDNGKIII